MASAKVTLPALEPMPLSALQPRILWPLGSTSSWPGRLICMDLGTVKAAASFLGSRDVGMEGSEGSSYPGFGIRWFLHLGVGFRPEKLSRA